jgi:hypothetical protein
VSEPPLDDRESRAEFLGALNTHYFVLQSAAGSTITESAARASLYLVSLSISLVAIASVAQSPSAFGPFLALLLPTLFVLGVFTVVRLVDTGLQNFVYVRSMARIREYYADLSPDASQFFGGVRDSVHAPLSRMAGRRRLRELFTIATMIAVIDSVVGGTGAALITAHVQGGFGRAPLLSLGIGLLVGVLLLGAFLAYQHRRYQVMLGATVAQEMGGS